MTRRALAAGCAAALLLGLAGCAPSGSPTPALSGAPAPLIPAPTPPSPSPVASPPASAPAADSGAIQHIVVIVDENKPAHSVIGDPEAPYLTSLAGAGALATAYSAVTHPSLPNYLALTSGTTDGITSDCNPPGGSCLITGPNVAQELDRAGRSWRMYAESMPAPCTTANTPLYAVKHNPFLYFPSVTSSAAYCAAHDVPYARFATDLGSASTLPAFSFISPNLCNDMHDCSISTGDAWLRANIPPILASPAFTTQRSLLVVTFDEGDSGDNVVACVFAGPAARAHAVVATPFTHYSLLRTIEEAWGLGALTGADGGAVGMMGMLG